MITKKMESAFNEQVNAEFWSAYLYLSMSAHFSSAGFPGVANWMRIQAKEESTHAAKFFDYILERDGAAILKPIAAVENKWESPMSAFEDVLKHEQKVTSLINNLMHVAVEEKDFASQSLLKWFIDEQVEEEANVKAILDSLRMVQGNGNGMYMIDRELATRVFVDSTVVAK